MSGMSGHVIIAGFGRVGELISQMLSERLIPFVALDVSASRVQARTAAPRPATSTARWLPRVWLLHGRPIAAALWLDVLDMACRQRHHLTALLLAPCLTPSAGGQEA